MLDDETLRDGLQSPSVRTPTIDEKIDILHLMDALGIDTADIGLPGAGPHVARDVERLARAIVDGTPAHPRELRRAHDGRRHQSRSPRSSSAPACRSKCGAFIGSSPIRQYAEGWTLDFLRTVHRGGASPSRSRKASDRHVRHGGHDARRSRVAAPAVHDRDPRRREAAVRRRHGRPRDAERRARGGHVREVADRRTGRRTSASTGTATATAASASPRASPRSRRAPRACTAPRSASASAAATRRSTCCWSIW